MIEPVVQQTSSQLDTSAPQSPNENTNPNKVLLVTPQKLVKAQPSTQPRVNLGHLVQRLLQTDQKNLFKTKRQPAKEQGQLQGQIKRVKSLKTLTLLNDQLEPQRFEVLPESRVFYDAGSFLQMRVERRIDDDRMTEDSEIDDAIQTVFQDLIAGMNQKPGQEELLTQ